MDGDAIVLLDVGARYGIHPRWQGLSRHLRAYAFEPDPEECQRINDNASSLSYHLECLPYALGNGNEASVPLYICEDPGCSSLYEPNLGLASQSYFGDRMKVTRTIRVSINRLDDVCEQRNLRPDALKVDTQGYELEILKGAGSILSDVKLVELEVEFNEQYRGQPLFSDVDLYMRSMGFALLGLRRSYWRRKVDQKKLRSAFGGQIMHGDAIYYNEKLINGGTPEISVKDLVKFCLLLSAYHQDDFVAYLCTKPHSLFSEIPENLRLQLASELRTRGGRVVTLIGQMLDAVRKRVWLPHAALRGMVDMVQSTSAEDWHDPDFY